MSRGWFVTGTDTGVGKTWISVGLMHALREEGLRVAGMKPVASGCDLTSEGLRNPDALFLQEAASLPLAYERVNPYAFARPIAPHLAAAEEGESIAFQRILDLHEEMRGLVDCTIVEGVGGWLVPLHGHLTVADLAEQLGLPVIVVVGLRLGCLNHAMLTIESIRHRGITIAGWVANHVDPDMQAVAETTRELALRIDAPMLGVMPHLATRHPSYAAKALNVAPLLAP